MAPATDLRGTAALWTRDGSTETPPTGAGLGDGEGAWRLRPQGRGGAGHRAFHHSRDGMTFSIELAPPHAPPTPDHQLESGRETTGRWRDRPRAAHVGVRV